MKESKGQQRCGVNGKSELQLSNSKHIGIAFLSRPMKHNLVEPKMLKTLRRSSSRTTGKNFGATQNRDQATTQIKSSSSIRPKQSKMLTKPIPIDASTSLNSETALRLKAKQLGKRGESLTHRIQGKVQVHSTGKLSMPPMTSCKSELKGRGS